MLIKRPLIAAAFWNTGQQMIYSNINVWTGVSENAATYNYLYGSYAKFVSALGTIAMNRSDSSFNWIQGDRR